MSDLELKANISDLWQAATGTQRVFLMNRILYPSDRQTCEYMGISHTNPIKWRKEDENYVKLENLYLTQPTEIALMYLRDLYPVALSTLHKAMMDEKMKGTQVDAAKAIHKACVDLEYLKRDESRRKFKLGAKDKYDDNDDKPALRAPRGAEGSTQIEGED